jgi:hypothetical protein
MPVDQDAHGRLWNRQQIETWAEEWRADKAVAVAVVYSTRADAWPGNP